MNSKFAPCYLTNLNNKLKAKKPKKVMKLTQKKYEPKTKDKN